MAKKTRNRKSQKGVRKSSSAPQQSKAATAQSRRAVLQYGVIGAAALLGGGYFATRSVRASIAEQDLSRIGQGVPAIVQVHDPQCPLCAALQKESRKALGNMSGEKPEFLVANIKTTDGGAFAARHGVPHVTLLLFDHRGELRQTLRGPQDRDALLPIFEEHMARYARRS